MKTLHLTIFGRVQNVNFRTKIWQEAEKHHVKGWVRNSSNISVVEACLQGRKEDVEAVITYIRSNPGYVKVEDIKIRETGERYEHFEIR